MTSICKKRKPALPRRLGRVLGHAFLLSLPCFLINLAAQGCKEFRKEIETGWKYHIILKNIKGKDR